MTETFEQIIKALAETDCIQKAGWRNMIVDSAYPYTAFVDCLDRKFCLYGDGTFVTSVRNSIKDEVGFNFEELHTIYAACEKIAEWHQEQKGQNA